MRIALLAAIALTAAAAVAYLWLTASRIAPEPQPRLPVAPEIQVKFDRITVRGRAEGDRYWELEAQSIEMTRDQSLTRLQGLRRATLYAGDKPQLFARAQWAALRSPSRDMELGGGVEVKSDAGLLLRTESLRWDAERERLTSAGPVEMELGETMVTATRAYYVADGEKIVCDGRVQIRQGENYLTGEKLSADLRAETLEIAGGVRMRLRVEEGRELTETEGPLGAMKSLLEKAPKEAR
ncbi:MAG: LPS export ABC transporter periplasmic protein LptC [Armatimonadota bacterium]|nr:MAG: LPS export ABC transporter periplasmic protein LptC [Armatimonadota bacterium]